MKRMNLIRATLFAVCTFMGTSSLSAQSWGTVQQARIAIHDALVQLAQPPAMPAPPAAGIQEEVLMRLYASADCPDCALNAAKKEFLQRIERKFIMGATDVGAAVEEVRAYLIANAGNHPGLLGLIQQTYIYMDTIL